MRFGIFYEHQLPRPWGPDSERQLIADALEQIEVADRVGFDCVWEVEHHFLEEYSHSSASDVFLAAASQRARNIRLGFGILPLPPGFEHPARRAETVATLDLVSNGRVDFGTGETSSGAELAGFGVDRATKREQWEEAIDVVTRMMVEEPFAGWDGRFGSMPPRNVVPKPVQKPHPPLWVACSRRETIRMAATRGIGALSFSFVEPEEAGAWVDEYYSVLASEECVPAGFAVNPNVAVVLPMMLAHDEAEAIERGIDGAHFFGYSLAHYYVFGDHRPGRTNIWDEFQERRDEVGFARHIVRPDQAPLGVRILQEGLGSLRGAIGTPEQVRELVSRYEQAGVDQIIFVLQAGRNRHEHIVESLELFGAEVLPQFAGEAREAREAEKAARLSDAVAAALARREPARASDPAYVIAPIDSGPPAATAGRNGRSPGARAASLAQDLVDRAVTGGEQAFAAFVHRSDDRRLERIVGSDAGLRVLFSGMTARYRPDAVPGFAGSVLYDLRLADGTAKPWSVDVGPERAVAYAGRSPDPALTMRVAVADFVRIAAHDLDPGKALMTGRLTFEGNLSIAMRLGEMFGETSAL
ncbi:LLM class flavin-dependent oxidoreductase [Capillimicrobium parvum]|uniref:Alkanesulfonate monooxygenase n=1 Tax=Capillimicrobium parvum TaxID=2884022 RepID=A0A9E7BZI3_9ACTN|nr:LLM class flavin-dependent oxidoreductase [Capillimicrobium parvum]UGS35356.1 Alkanesulfonate monooxygenase [Capillimicrobium parvum]